MADSLTPELRAFVAEQDELRNQCVPEIGAPWWTSVRYRNTAEGKFRAALAEREAQLAEARRLDLDVRNQSGGEHLASFPKNAERVAFFMRMEREHPLANSSRWLLLYEVAESQLAAVRALRDEVDREIETPNANPMRLAIARPSEMLRYFRSQLDAILTAPTVKPR